MGKRGPKPLPMPVDVPRRYWVGGESFTALAVEYGVYASTVRRWLHCAGVSHRPAQRRPRVRLPLFRPARPRPVRAAYLPPRRLFTRDEWEAMYWDPTEFPSLNTLAVRLGLHPNSVHAILGDLGIPTRSRVEQMRLEWNYGRVDVKGRKARGRGPISRVTPEIMEEWRKRYEGGEPARVLAGEFGYSQSRVYLAIHAAGVPVRRRAGRGSAGEVPCAACGAVLWRGAHKQKRNRHCFCNRACQDAFYAQSKFNA